MNINYLNSFHLFKKAFIKKLPLKLNFSPFVTILYNFGVSSEYDAEEGSLRLYVTNVNEALQILAAKE